jgi:hypothetical protein
MTQLSLTVGQVEKHNLEVLASLRGAQVHIDGKPVSKFNAMGRDRMAKFSVGEKETHDVEVRVHGYLFHKIDVLVDGKFIGSG